KIDIIRTVRRQGPRIASIGIGSPDPRTAVFLKIEYQKLSVRREFGIDGKPCLVKQHPRFFHLGVRYPQVRFFIRYAGKYQRAVRPLNQAVLALGGSAVRGQLGRTAAVGIKFPEPSAGLALDRHQAAPVAADAEVD